MQVATVAMTRVPEPVADPGKIRVGAGLGRLTCPGAGHLTPRNVPLELIDSGRIRVGAGLGRAVPKRG